MPLLLLTLPISYIYNHTDLTTGVVVRVAQLFVLVFNTFFGFNLVVVFYVYVSCLFVQQHCLFQQFVGFLLHVHVEAKFKPAIPTTPTMPFANRPSPAGCASSNAAVLMNGTSIAHREE